MQPQSWLIMMRLMIVLFAFDYDQVDDGTTTSMLGTSLSIDSLTSAA